MFVQSYTILHTGCGWELDILLLRKTKLWICVVLLLKHKEGQLEDKVLSYTMWCANKAPLKSKMTLITVHYWPWITSHLANLGIHYNLNAEYRLHWVNLFSLKNAKCCSWWWGFSLVRPLPALMQSFLEIYSLYNFSVITIMSPECCIFLHNRHKSFCSQSILSVEIKSNKG